MFIDIDCSQVKKYNQNAYGDYFVSKRYPDEERLVAVLSDGLGSGITRALRSWPHIDFVDDHESCLFRAVIRRVRMP